jgi:FAD:protein FMN transferase
VTVRTFGTMGTVVSVRLPDDVDAGVVPEVEAVFSRYDRTYSLWDEASPLSAVAREEIALMDTDAEIRDVYARTIEWRRRTNGAFTPHRPDGVVDLSGIVKALAIADAGDVLDTAADDWLLNAGGDVLVRGTHRGEPWSVGVVDPDQRDALAAVVPLGPDRRALATSGVAERGEHIWRRSVPVFVQATVLADDIVSADVLATAIVAGDESDLEALTRDGAVDVLAFDRDGRFWATPAAVERFGFSGRPRLTP